MCSKLERPNGITCNSASSTAKSSSRCSSLIDLAGAWEENNALQQVYLLSSGVSSCALSSTLSLKYGLEQDNDQIVITITNRVTLEQASFNKVRSQKPQTFTHAEPSAPDAVAPRKACDFCDWEELTAQDPWGRIEGPHAITASNLFKYAQPYHGLALFRHHDPLSFTLPQLADLCAVSGKWMLAAAAEHALTHSTTLQQQQQQQQQQHSSCSPSADCPASPASHGPRHSQDAVTNGSGGTAVSGPAFIPGGQRPVPDPLWPFFLWNCNARAGASQAHGHAQLIMSAVPLPAQVRQDQAVAAYNANNSSHSSSRVGGGALPSHTRCYYSDLLSAHEAAGLLEVQEGEGGDRAWALPSLAPVKDMEVLILGSGMASPAFVTLLHRTLRALIDRLGVDSFNVGLLNMGHPATLPPPLSPVNHRAPSQHLEGGDAAAALPGAVGRRSMASGDVEQGSREGQDVVRAGSGVGRGGLAAGVCEGGEQGSWAGE
ncbi:MAG: hypothetical protein WDW36_010080 [Sanguina aurantia]